MSLSMPLKVLIIPDKFKGTLTARAAAEAIARGWRRARPGDALRLMAMSDGGDGFGEVMSALLHAKGQTVRTVDAAHRACVGRWWWEPKTRTAIVESANVIGLAMLRPGSIESRKSKVQSRERGGCRVSGVGGGEVQSPESRVRTLKSEVRGARFEVGNAKAEAGDHAEGEFHPFALDTFGLGAVLGAAGRMGARRCIVGIGGSATNDGGFGLARACGWEFFDEDGSRIERWTDLGRLEHIRAPRVRWCFRELVVAVDVQNPLLGPRGAARVYGPQKGLRRDDFGLAEGCLRRLGRVVAKQFGRDFAREPGAGAAGGLGFGLLAFLGARLEPGFALFARYANLDHRLDSTDLVVTGEGAIDDSTLMGKGVGQVMQRCGELGIPCIALGGAVTARVKSPRTFREAHALTELTTIRQAKAKPAFWLERLAGRAAAQWLQVEG